MSDQTLKIELAEPFEPLYSPKRYKVYYGGRGGGKSYAIAQYLLIKGYQHKTRILCTREFQGSIRESVHRLLSDTIERLGLGSFYDVQQQAIHGRNGTHFFFAGLKNNITAIKSVENIQIVWVEEGEAVTERSWDTLIPTIRAADSEIIVSFNPQVELDATYQRFVEPYLDTIEKDGWYDDDKIHVHKVGWRENPWFPDELMAEMETCKAQDHNKYLHIWEGETKAAVEGAIYGEQLQKAEDDGRITSVPTETSLVVHTAWDLGVNDTTAIVFFQASGKEIRVIDCYEGRMQGLDHYARILKEKDYLYGNHYLPHDVEVTELSSNTTRLETLEQLGVKPIDVVPRISNINEGIEATRQMFPRVWFDRKGAAELISALRTYQYVYDEKYNTFRQKPLHNAASNYSDAFRQIAQGFANGSWGGYDPATYDPSKFTARGVRQ